MKELLLGLLLVQPALAHCPLCTAAAGSGLAFTRFYGVDDVIVGLWLGAFVISSALWLSRLLGLSEILSVSVFSVFTILPLYFFGILGNPHYFIFGVDKLLIGFLAGSGIIWLIPKIKKFFPYQSLVLSLISLTFLSVVVWLVL